MLCTSGLFATLRTQLFMGTVSIADDARSRRSSMAVVLVLFLCLGSLRISFSTASSALADSKVLPVSLAYGAFCHAGIFPLLDPSKKRSKISRRY